MVQPHCVGSLGNFVRKQIQSFSQGHCGQRWVGSEREGALIHFDDLESLDHDGDKLQQLCGPKVTRDQKFVQEERYGERRSCAWDIPPFSFTFFLPLSFSFSLSLPLLHFVSLHVSPSLHFFLSLSPFYLSYHAISDLQSGKMDRNIIGPDSKLWECS